MKKPLATISCVVNNKKDDFSQDDIKIMEDTLKHMEILLDELVADISKSKSV